MLEITKVFTKVSNEAIHEQLKITNLSDDYVNDVMLTIQKESCPLTYQVIKRERGILDFTPPTLHLELGNLAPNESAYFEYKCKMPTSLVDQLSLTYAHQDKISNK